MKNYHIVKRRASNSEIRYRPALMHPKQDIIIGVLAGESLYDTSCHLERLIDTSLKTLLELKPIEPSCKDEWEVKGETEVYCGDRLIANCGGYFENKNTRKIREENEANARLIATTVNACINLNPDDPMAVAEGISGLCKACNLFLCNVGFVFGGEKPNKELLNVLRDNIEQAVAKAKRS